MVEDRFPPLIEFDDFLLVRRNQGDVLAGLLKDALIVDVDVAERIVEQVPQNGSGLAVLGEKHLDLLESGYFLPGRLPLPD